MSTDGRHDDTDGRRDRQRWRSVGGHSCLAAAILAVVACMTLLVLADRVLVVVGDDYLEPASEMPWVVAAAGALALLGWTIARGPSEIQTWVAGIRTGLVVWCLLAFCAAASHVGLVVIFFGNLIWHIVLIASLATVVSFVSKSRDRRAGREVPPRHGQAAVAALVIVTATILASEALLVSDDTVTLDRTSSGTTIVRTEGLFWQERTTVYRAAAGSPFAHHESTTVVEK